MLRFVTLPTVVHPEPVRRVAPQSGFEGPIDVPHDGLDRARLSLIVRRYAFTGFNPPPGQTYSITDRRIESALVAQSKDCGGGGSRAFVTHERQPQAIGPGMLIGQKP